MSHIEVILVDDNDREVGFMEKLAAHKVGARHRAVSVYVFNSRNELLLPQVKFAEFQREVLGPLEAQVPATPTPCLVDRKQLQQVLTALVQNALTYGRLPGEPARVAVRVHQAEGGPPLVDVVDRGPGIPEATASQLFKPFHTTSPHGTGLGLYIARELCLANQASLDHVPLPAGGACFRIRLVPAGSHAFARA